MRTYDDVERIKKNEKRKNENIKKERDLGR